jgi:hypothetical protein
MKTVLNLLNNKVMKNAIKYICALLLLVGVNVSAWGTVINGTNYSISSDAINFGNLDASNSDYIAAGVIETYTTITITLTSAQNTYAYFVASPDDYYITGYSDAGQLYVGNSIGAHTLRIYTFFPLENGTHTRTLYISIGSSYEEIEVTGTVINACTSHSITLTDGGIKAGGSFSTNVSSSCKDETITITATPDAGYRVDTWTVLDGIADDVELSGTGNTRTFTMPNSDTEVEVTFAAQTYDVTLKPNGGSGSDQVVRVTYGEIPPTTLKVGGGAVVIPTRTGYDFDGYYDVSASTGGTQYYSYKGNPKALAAENLWDKANDANLYARWIAHTLTITLDKGTGGTNDGTAVVDYGTSALGDIDHATNSTTGYHLDGYYTLGGTKILEANGDFAADNITSYISDGNWIYDDDVTLYAHWALNTYTVHFNKNNNDATGNMSDQVFTYGTAQNLTSCGFSLAGKVFDGWATSAGGEKAYNNGAEVNNLTTTNEATVNLFAKWRDGSYTDYVFSCAELTLTPKLVTAGAPMFITSAAGKKVRSQDSILIVGSGLTPSTALTFPDLHAKFEIKSRTGAALATDASGAINAVAYIFYTPAVGDTDDGLDEIAGITVRVEGAKPKTASLTQSIIGRHLPAAFVIAVKHDDNQWYALPADMSGTGNPAPVAIRVDNTSSPTTAYCDNTNAYSLYASTLNNISVQLAMPNNPHMANAALWANNALSSTNIGKNGNTNGSSTDLGGNYQWLFTQTATSVSGIGDVKYTMSNPNNAYPLKVWTNAGSTLWGLYSSGSAEIRLLSMEVVKPLSLKVMEWGTDAIVVSYPNGGSATSPQVRIGDGDAANVTLTSLGGDIYKIATISNLQSNPAKTLIFTATESSVAKQIALAIPLIVSDVKTEADLRGAVPGANATEKNKVAKLTDVIIRNGGRLTTGTASGDFNDVYIYPGGKAKITNNFAARNIYMRGGYSFLDEKTTFRYPDLCVEGAVTIDLPAANKLYYDFYIDNRKYYMFSMPYDVTLASVTDEAGYDNFPVWVKHYDGNLRASGHGVSGWTWYGDDEETQHSFFAGIGYEITAKPKISGRPIAIIRFPVITGDITTDAGNSPGVTVTYYGKSAYETGTQTANNVGWNFIGNPYLTEYKAVSDTSMIVKSDFVQHKENGQWDGTYEWKETSARFITVPYDTYNDYHHELVKGYTIPAFSTFFFQFAKDATGTFHMGGDRPQAALAPARFGATPKATPEISLDIMLSGTGEAEEGKAGLIIHDKYDGGLKDFEDVEQWFVDKNVQKTYTFASGTALAYNLLNEEAINELIPMGYIATVGGEHVYALNEENDVSALEHLWLIDYTTGVTTDLLVRNYSFVTAAGRFDSRFAINAVLKQEEVPTNISNTPGGDWTTTIGVYSGENMLTLRGLPDNSAVYIYDMNGRLLQSSEKLSNIASFSIATQGVYNIRVIAEGKAITLRTVLR